MTDPGTAPVAGGDARLGFVPCPGCGALVPDDDGPIHAYLGASPGCWSKWGRFQARAYGVPGFGRVQPLAVDAYAVQHPGGPDRRAVQSVWVHLASICLILERGGSPADGIRLKQRLLERPHHFERLEPPAAPSWMTIAHVEAAPDLALEATVERWAASVWAAWAAHHDAVRVLLDRASV